jgi:formylglycine-generating enzyme required for sulfatase activity
MTVAPNRVVLGGDYGDDASLLRSASRLGNTPRVHDNTIGVRCARTGL